MGKCDCPACRARVKREFARVIKRTFTEDDVARIADEVLHEFPIEAVAHFVAGPDNKEAA
jgi:ferredoxin